MISQRLDDQLPPGARAILRGLGQIFFQESAFCGLLFAAGLAASSPSTAAAALVGSSIGWATARVLRFDQSESAAGIFGFNAALVGIASVFYFQPGVASVLLAAAGCVAATLLTQQMRRRAPFPTYTTPFIITTWGVYLLGRALELPASAPGGSVVGAGVLTAAAHGVSQVMFQASVATAVLFLVGIALSDWRHALWTIAGALLGALLASYHLTAALRTLDPERLIERALTENIMLGLYGYNAALTATAMFLWRRSLIPPLLGILVSVPITESFPQLGLPALTAPFVLSSWFVLLLGRLDAALLGGGSSTPR